MCPYRTACVLNMLLLLYLNVAVGSLVSGSELCIEEDALLSSTARYQFVYNGTIRLQHSTADGSRTAAYVSLQCAVTITGQAPCRHAIKFSSCSVGPESALQRSPLQDEALSQLTRNGAHFVQRNGSVESIWVASGESESVTNIRRGVINMLRVSKPILDASATVERSEDDSVRYVMTMEDVMSQDVRCPQPVVSPLQPLQNMEWLDSFLAAPLTCNYVLQEHHHGQVKCRQSRDLWLPAGEQVTVDVSQELILESVSSLEGAEDEGAGEEGAEHESAAQEGAVEVPTQFTCQHLETPIAGDQTSESFYERMAALVGSSVPLVTPGTPQQFLQLLQTLRDNFSDPFLFSQTCQDCTTLQKEFAASAAGSALFQCGSSVCLSAVTDTLRSGHLTVQQLTPVFLSWLWSHSRDEENFMDRFALCDATAVVSPSSSAWRRCHMALVAELGYRGQHESDMAPVKQKLMELMARAASTTLGNKCDGEELLVVHSLKVLANLGSLVLAEDGVQDHLETCALQSGRDVIVVTEALRTLDRVSSDIRLQEVVKTIVSDPSHHLLSRQLAYLTLMRRFPTEESYMYCLQMAGQSPRAPISVFIKQHVHALSPDQPGYAESRRALSGLADYQQAPPEDGYNSFRDSSVSQLKLPLWPNSAAEVTLSAWRLHGASFLPHMLYVNVSVTGLPRGVQIGPFEMELRGVGIEQLVHQLLSSPQLDQLPAVVEWLVRAYAQLFGGSSFEFGTFSEQLPLLSTTVADWFQQLLDHLQLSDDPVDILEPAAMLTISASGHQLLYFTAAELWDSLNSSESFVDPVVIVGRKLSHTEHIFKPLEARYKMWLPLGVPLDIFSDATLAASAAAMLDSRLEMSNNNILENFVGDVNISASAAVSLVSVLQVSLLSKARADFVMNTTANLPLYLPLSYARNGRVLTVNLTKPHRDVTVAYLSHDITLTEGSGRWQPAPSDSHPAVSCPSWARYMGLTVCVRSQRSSPVLYHITAVDAEPWTPVYSVDLWSSARDDGYQFGGSAHLLLRRPAVAAHPVHLIWSFRLKPANYNTQLFNRGQKSNTTLQLLVGDSSVPVWLWYFRHAQTEMGDVLFTEYIIQASNRDQLLVQGAFQSNISLPWALEDGWRNEVAVDVSFAGQEMKYVRRASTSFSGDADLFVLAQYNTKHESSIVQRILAPEFYDVQSRSAHLRVNITRRVVSDEMMRSMEWRHLLVISTPGLVISGGLDAASSVDSGAALVANLTTSSTTDGRLITYIAATASHIPAILGDDLVDLWEVMLSAPGRSAVARARLLTTSSGSQTFNGSLETSTGDAGVAPEVVHWVKVSASVSGTKSDMLDYSAQLELPGNPDDVISLNGDWSGDWPRPLTLRLPWRPFSVQHSCRVSWPRAGVTVTSQLWATNSSDEIRVETRLDGRRAAAAAGVSLQLFWNRLQPLWNSQLLVESPLVQINNSLIATPSGSGQMLHELSHLSTSSLWELLDLDVQGTLRVDCSDCAVQQRSVDAKLRHKWGRVSLKSLRQVANSTSLPKLQSLDLRVDGKVDFMPSLTCRLKSADDFSLSLDIPSMGVPSQLELQYLLVPPSTWNKKQIRSVDVNLASAGAALSSGVYVAMETEPRDPSHLAVEFELNPRPWMPLVTAVLHKYKQVAMRFWQTLLDPDWPVNRLLAPIISSQTLAHWVQQLPETTSNAVSWTFDRLAVLASPWSAVVDPVYVTLNNAQHYTTEMFSKLIGPPKSQTNGDGFSLPTLTSIQDRVRSLIPAAVMQQLVKVFNGAVSSAMARLPFSVHQSAQEGGRTRLEIRDLPPYANLETIWNVSSVLSARLRAPSPLNQLLSWHRQPRVPAAASWTSRAAVALDGRTFQLPESDRCAQLLLADLEARRFVVLRLQRHLSIILPDCSVLLDDRGYVSVRRFSNTDRTSSVWVSGDWLRVRASSGLRVDVHIFCMTAEFLVDVWMLRETIGLLAPHSAGANLSLIESVRQFSVPLIDEDNMWCSGPSARATSHHASPAAATLHQVLPAAVSQAASCNTAGCQRFIASSHSDEPRPSVCATDDAATTHATIWRLHDPSPPLLDSPPSPLYVVYAVSDPSVTASTLASLSEAIRRLISGFERRAVYVSLLPAAQQLHSLSWTDSAKELSMEGRKLPCDDVIRSLQKMLTTPSVFPAHSRRLLVLFSNSAETEDAASLISLQRMLQRRRMAVHVVTSLGQYVDLPISIRGVSADGDVIPADDGQSVHALKAAPPELGLTALVDDIAGAVWNRSLLYGIGGDVTSYLLADRVWQWLSEIGVMHERVVSEYDEVVWKQEHSHDEQQKAYQSSAAASSAVVFISPLSLILALPHLYRLGRL